MKVRNDIILRQIAGENILIPVGEAARQLHGMVCLNESGLLLWNALSEERTEAELTAMLLSAYDTDPETAAADVWEFLETVRGLGVLVE